MRDPWPISFGPTGSSQAEQLPGVLVQYFSFDLLVGRKLPNLRQLAGARTDRGFAGGIVAIAPVQQLVLVALEKSAGVIGVALERVFPGAGGQVGIHVRIVAEIAIG